LEEEGKAVGVRAIGLREDEEPGEGGREEGREGGMGE